MPGQIDGRLYQWLIHTLATRAMPWCTSVIAFCLLYVQALMVNYMVNEYRMIVKRQPFLPAMALPADHLAAAGMELYVIAVLANTFIIWMFIYLFRLYNVYQCKGADI